MCKGTSKQTPELRILPRRAPGFEIPGSATGDDAYRIVSIKED